MAERRMFAKTIIDSDAFLDMPVTARLLYYDLAMRADDDGFVNGPKKIMRIVGASQDDLSILALRKFIIPFDSGVVVIKHWRIHNYVRQDTYRATPYTKEKQQLTVGENKAYSLSVNAPSTDCQRIVDDSSTQDSIGKDSIGECSVIEADKPPRTRFTPPDLEEVKAYCSERGKGVDPVRFYDYNVARGWMIGKNKMKDWKAAVRTWERTNQPEQKTEPIATTPRVEFKTITIDGEEVDVLA